MINYDVCVIRKYIMFKMFLLLLCLALSAFVYIGLQDTPIEQEQIVKILNID